MPGKVCGSWWQNMLRYGEADGEREGERDNIYIYTHYTLHMIHIIHRLVIYYFFSLAPRRRQSQRQKIHAIGQ